MSIKTLHILIQLPVKTLKLISWKYCLVVSTTVIYKEVRKLYFQTNNINKIYEVKVLNHTREQQKQKPVVVFWQRVNSPCYVLESRWSTPIK